MKETEFKPGEYCFFANKEIPAMLDLLRENDHQVWKDRSVYNSKSEIILCGNDGDILGSWLPCSDATSELTREQFMFKATRGKGVKPEFDPSKPFEVSMDGHTWYKRHFYVGLSEKGKYVIECDGCFHAWDRIRNIAFTAAMLEVGEWMQVTQIGPYEDWVVQMTSENTLHCPEYAKTLFGCGDLTGRRVKVNITTEEI